MLPAADTGASLAYAQSYSLVEYLVDVYGWDRMRRMLALFAEGATSEGPIQSVYGVDLDTLDSEWRAALR